MFTGIVQAVGKITAIESHGGDKRLVVDSANLDMDDVQAGDSIAVNGVCLTVLGHDVTGFKADVSNETLACTTFADLRVGTPVNLEKALAAGDRLGGHLVSGHVDGVAEVLKRQQQARSVRLSIEAPAVLARYIAAKGSICLDGVSLTVNSVQGAMFEVNIVPHTADATIASDYQVGRRVNLEVDMLARYLERLLLGERASQKNVRLTESFLAEHGFLKK